MLKRLIACLLVCTMAGSLMASCGGNSTGDDAKTVSMSIWHRAAEDTDETSYHQRFLKIANAFEEKNEGYDVNVVGSVTDEKMLTALSAGNGPDIVSPFWIYCAQWGTEGVLANLTDLINNDEAFDKEDIIPAAWDRCTYKGNIYSIPTEINSSELYYNKDILEEAGAEVPKTISELVDLAINLSEYDENGNLTRVGFIPNYPWLDNVLWPVAFGAKWIDEETNQITFDSDAMKAAYQWQIDIYNALGYEKLVTFRTGLGSDGESPFVVDKLALQFGGEWMIDDIQKYRPDMNYGVAYCPYPDGQPELEGSMFLTCTVLAINNDSANTLDDNWKLLSHMTSKESLQELAKGTNDSGSLLSRKSALNNLPDSASPVKKEVAQMIQDPNVSGFPLTYYVNDYLAIINDELAEVFDAKSGVTLDDAAAKIQAQAQEFADKYPIN